MRVFLTGAMALLAVSVSQAVAEDPVPPISIALQTVDIQVAADGSSVENLHAELHAENDVGAIRLNQVPLAFNSAFQDLQVVEAYTRKPDGSKIPVDMNAIFTRLPTNESQSGQVTDMRLKVVVFPQTVAGDTVVYTAKYLNRVVVFPGTFTHGSAFNVTVPIGEERDTITAPKSLGLRTETHGVDFTTEDHGSDVVYRWRYAQPKPVALAPVAVSPLDQLPRYFVSNIKDYTEVGTAYAKLLSSKLVVTPKVAALAEKVTEGEKSRREQARKLYEWVNANIRYIAIELGQGTMVPHDVDDILTYGYGDCKDHDLLLRALLKAKGIDSRSVLINSGNAYTLTEVPTFFQLNHVITSVPEFGLFLDSSALANPFAVLPYGEYGKPAIHVSENTATLGTTPVLQPGIASEHTTNVMRLSPTGVLTGTVTTTAKGPSQTSLRIIGLAFQAVSPETIAQQQLQARGYRGGTGTLRAGPPLVRGQSYTITGDYTVPGWQEWISGAKVSFMPIGLRVLGIVGDGPMGTLRSLQYKDLDATPCFSIAQSEDNSLEIPANTRFAVVPPDVKISSEAITFTAQWKLTGNVLAVHREFHSKIAQPLCKGEVRKQVAMALFKIAASYILPIKIVPATNAPALVSQNEPVEPLPPLAMNEASDSLVAVAQAGDTNRAAQLLDKLMPRERVQVADTAYSTHLAQGLDYLNASQLLKAVAELSEAIRLNPAAGPEPYQARATAYSKMNKTRLAMADLEAALRAAPDDVKLRQMHADLALKARNYDVAAADYNVMVRHQPDDPALVMQRAEIRYHADKYEEAAADYRRALRLGVSETEAKPGLCKALARSEMFAQAVDHCSWVLRQDAKSAEALEARGAAYFQLGKYGDALKDFDQAAKANPQKATFLFERGMTALKLGNKTGQKDVDAALKLEANVAKKIPGALTK